MWALFGLLSRGKGNEGGCLGWLCGYGQLAEGTAERGRFVGMGLLRV
jgi:hypothetical protein